MYTTTIIILLYIYIYIRTLYTVVMFMQFISIIIVAKICGAGIRITITLNQEEMFLSFLLQTMGTSGGAIMNIINKTSIVFRRRAKTENSASGPW